MTPSLLMNNEIFQSVIPAEAGIHVQLAPCVHRDKPGFPFSRE
jgi:hypothetical protein